MENKEVEALLEGILFAAGEPIPVTRLCNQLSLPLEMVEYALGRLEDFYKYEQRGIRLLRLEDAVQLCSAPQFAEQIRIVLETRRPPRLSQPALEVLTIVAYFQPVTRAYIDQVRGVDSTYTVGLLVDRGLLEEAGRLAVPGRPIQYQTTEAFLRVFGLASLKDLAPLPEQEETGNPLDLLQAQGQRKDAAQVQGETDQNTER